MSKTRKRAFKNVLKHLYMSFNKEPCIKVLQHLYMIFLLINSVQLDPVVQGSSLHTLYEYWSAFLKCMFDGARVIEVNGWCI